MDKGNEKKEKGSGGDRLETGMNGNNFWIKPESPRGCRVNDDDVDDNYGI